MGPQKIIFIFFVAIMVMIFGVYLEHLMQLPVESPMEPEPAGQESAGPQEPVQPESPPPAAGEDVVGIEEITDHEETDKSITILVKRNGFNQESIMLNPGILVYWKNIDDRTHKVACYMGTSAAERKRVFISQQLNPGDQFSYIFWDEGEYECRDAVFGYWGNISIQTPTGFAVADSIIDYSVKNPIEIGMVLIIVVLFTIHGVYVHRKSKKSR